MFEFVNLKQNGIYDAYLRKSRADMSLENIKKIDTLKQHEKFIIERAKQLNITIRKWYKEVVSGDTIADRPEIQKMLRDIECGQVDGILVVDVDRLARGDTTDQGRIARTFKYTDTKIITLQKIYDPNNDEDEEYFEFNLYMARKEYKAINKRLQRGRLSAVLEGKFCASVPPFGYDKVKIQKGKGFKLVPNADEAPIVKEIFKKRLHGMGKNIICNYLNNQGIPPRKSDVWTPATITTLLSNPVYIGKLRWGYNTMNKSIENGEIIKKRIRKENCILVEGLHDAIIDENTFNSVQKKKTPQQPAVRNDKSLKNPLAGLITCAVCGRKMVRRPYSSKQKTRAENNLNKAKLLQCLREHKGNYSLTQIAKKIGYSKYTVDNYFANSVERFTVPKVDAWYKLKKLLNIKTNEFDNDIKLYHTVNEEVHIDSIMCPKAHCSNVASHLYLVENKVIETIESYYNEYKLLEEVPTVAKNEDTDTLNILKKKGKELSAKLNKAYDLVESGVYTPEEFTERTKAIKLQIDKNKKEILKIEKLNNKENVEPLLAITEKIINEYDLIESTETKNFWLKSIINKIDYLKIKGGKTNYDKFDIKIQFKF